MKDRYTESFENFFKRLFGKGCEYPLCYVYEHSDLERVFDDQQSKINELLERLRECEESLGVYASMLNWQGGVYGTMREINTFYLGGKRAREYFKKYEDKNV